MKRRYIFVAIIGLILPFFFNGLASDCKDLNDIHFQSIKSIIGDSVFSDLIDGKDAIIYYTGHHGIVWSMITYDAEEYRLYNGSTRDWDNQLAMIPIDTTKFVKDNSISLKWAFDSLTSEVANMVPCRRMDYNPIYNELLFIHNDSIVFRLNNTKNFSGDDSIGLNRKIHLLVFTMYWLASPTIREYITIPSSRHNN